MPVSNGPAGIVQNCPSKSSWMNFYPSSIASFDVNTFLPLAVSNTDFCFFFGGGSVLSLSELNYSSENVSC